MFKIGHFAKLGQVSVKTLRWYDELGLLKPMRIDSENGYRHYGIEQLPRLNRILALKELGLSLEQIVMLLKEDLPAEQLRGILKLKRAELQQHIAEEQARLRLVDARLRQIEEQAVPFQYDIIVKRVDPLLVASIRDAVSTYPEVGSLTAEIYAYLSTCGENGIDGAVWHDLVPDGHDLDVEGVVFLERPVAATGRIQVYHLPGVEHMASTIHHGSYLSLHRAYIALGRWIESNGYRLSGPARDIYLKSGDAQDDEAYVTEVQMPIG
jgi:DNA-binding transcriptional MerR regulator